MKFVTSLLLILAIATSAISPACAFFGGKMMDIEICKSDGSVETIQVSSDQSPGSDSQNNMASKDCAFCILASFGKALISAFIAIIMQMDGNFAVLSALILFSFIIPRATFEATGPPSALV